ncbi:apolipoprotein N-acyltransferase [Embleya sp. NPDC056575]|uniref:apolipoprotein N-acyltransferase n=1 Tax=unclassified Embleya TaxID=2699296 RepID=UPI0036A7C844
MTAVRVQVQGAVQRRLRTWAGAIMAASGGLLLALAFPPVGLWPAAAVGPALLLAAIRHRRAKVAFRLGTLFGLTFFIPLLWWLTNLGILPWLALSVAQALLLGLLCCVVPTFARLPGWPLWAACWWVTTEAVRSRVPLGGFPWGRLGFSQADAPTLGWASVAGAPGVSAVVALTAAFLAALLTAPRAYRVRFGAGLVVAGALASSGVFLLPSTHGERTAKVAVVQGNVPRARNMEEQARVQQVAENHIAATRELARDIKLGKAPQPDLVLWPENATDRDPRTDVGLREGISLAAREVGAPIVVGAILDASHDRIRNTSLLWFPDTGPGRYYAKQQLVPFGEYIPLRDLIGGLGDLQLIPRDFVAGSGPVRLDVGPIHLASSICYEVAYDGQVRGAVRTGANLLAVPTNNATYMRNGSLAEPKQQLAMSRLRAVEHGRSVLVASTTGISAVVAPDGTIVKSTDPWTRTVLNATVPLRSETTLATRLGELPEGGLVLIAVAAMAEGIRRSRRDRRDATPATATAGDAARTADAGADSATVPATAPDTASVPSAAAPEGASGER